MSLEAAVTALRIEMSELAHWDCWAWCGDRHINRPEPNSTPEHTTVLD